MKRTWMPRASRKQKAFEAAWKVMRARILERDAYRCKACGAGGLAEFMWSGRPRLEVHHVIKRSRDPKKKLDPSNLVTLCSSCHAATDLPFALGRLVVLALGEEKFSIKHVTAKDKWDAAGRTDAARGRTITEGTGTV